MEQRLRHKKPHAISLTVITAMGLSAVQAELSSSLEKSPKGVQDWSVWATIDSTRLIWRPTPEAPKDKPRVTDAAGRRTTTLTAINSSHQSLYR